MLAAGRAVVVRPARTVRATAPRLGRTRPTPLVGAQGAVPRLTTRWLRCRSMSRMNRTWAVGVTALALAGLMGSAGCGEERAAQPAGAVPASASASAVETQMVKVIRRVSPAVVQIQCGRSLGSGIVFDGRGDVATNAHVIGGARSCTVTLPVGNEHPATVVGTDTTHDVAVVHLAGATPDPATFGDSDKVQVGDMVLAMGNPLGLRSSVTQGIVSSLNRNV